MKKNSREVNTIFVQQDMPTKTEEQEEKIKIKHKQAYHSPNKGRKCKIGKGDDLNLCFDIYILLFSQRYRQ